MPFQNKQATTVEEGFDVLLDKSKGRAPQKVRTDPGGEFANRIMKKWFDDHDILHSVTHNEMKRTTWRDLIKTIKSRIVKYFNFKNTHEYVSHLDDFMEGYNDTYHSGIKMKPSSVNKNNELMLWQQQYIEPFVKETMTVTKKENSVKKNERSVKKKSVKKKKFRFATGDKVHISHLRSLFQREYDQRWTGEVFTVTKSWSREGVYVHELKDYGDDPVSGTFYEPELQAVTFDAEQPFKIEKVIKTRGRGANKEHYVKWMNWPNKYNSWIKDYVHL